jgi:hypothetical protein
MIVQTVVLLPTAPSPVIATESAVTLSSLGLRPTAPGPKTTDFGAVPWISSDRAPIFVSAASDGDDAKKPLQHFGPFAVVLGKHLHLVLC